MNKPRKCPVCGGSWSIWITTEPKWFVRCMECGFKSAECDSEEEAVKSWNEEFN